MTNTLSHTANAIEAEVLQTWHDNASAWTNAVRTDQIASRRLVTNQAIIDAVLKHQPRKVLDLGCGEGWLAGQLAAKGLSVTGVDAIAELTDAAQQQYGDKAEFLTLPYDQVPAALAQLKFDLIVCNFSLLGNESVAKLLQSLPPLLNEAGVMLIQTLHPDTAVKADEQSDGWRRETWQGIGEGFRGSAPWYYRTRTSWQTLFDNCLWQLRYCLEPKHPQTLQAASIIFCLESKPRQAI